MKVKFTQQHPIYLRDELVASMPRKNSADFFLARVQFLETELANEHGNPRCSKNSLPFLIYFSSSQIN